MSVELEWLQQIQQHHNTSMCRGLFRHGPRAWTTNGSALGHAVCNEEWIVPSDREPNGLAALIEADGVEWSPLDLPALLAWLGPQPECRCASSDGVVDCDKCNGSGYRECDLGHDHVCKGCGGEGWADCDHSDRAPEPVTLLGKAPYNAGLLRAVLPAHVEACEWGEHGADASSGRRVHFRWSGGGLAVMQLRGYGETPARAWGVK